MDNRTRKVQIKRINNYSSLSGETALDYGEPLYIDDEYLAIGTKDGVAIKSGKLFRAYKQDRINKAIFLNDTNELGTVSTDGTVNIDVSISKDSRYVDTTNTPTTNTFYYITGVTEASSATSSTHGSTLYCANATDSGRSVSNAGIKFNGSTGILYGAAWNDYAEYRQCSSEVGNCVVETPDGYLIDSYKKHIPGAKIVSDTFGMVIGEENGAKPIAVCGRVLAKVDDKSKLKVGDAVMSSTNGRVTKMNRLQKILYPECIIGIVSEIPEADSLYNGVNVNGRVWISLK